MRPSVEIRALRKVGRRLIPFLAVLYFAAFLDRVNVGFAALQMNRDLGLTAYIYGLGAGIFFLGYCLFEVPSNLLLHRFGGRRWLARIMVTWGLVSAAFAFVQGPVGFCVLRFLLGVAEAGFFPGVIYFLNHWIPAGRRARVIGAFMAAVPISTAIGGPLSSAILALDGTRGIAGWQWLFLLEAVPSLALGFATLRFLPDRPEDARWLEPEERDWLLGTLAAEREGVAPHVSGSLLAVLTHPRILTLALCYFGVQIPLYGVVLWLPQILRSGGIEPAAIGAVVAVPYGLAALAMVLWSRHSDRKAERRWHLVVAALLTSAGLLATAALPAASRLTVLTITLATIGTFSLLPVFWTVPSALLRGASAAAAIALINSIGNIGGFVGPVLIGWLKDSTGEFAPGLVAAALGTFLTAGLALRVGRIPAMQADAIQRPELRGPASG